MHFFRRAGINATYLIGKALVITYGKPVFSAIWGSSLQKQMKMLDKIFIESFLSVIDDIVYATEMVDSLNDIIHIHSTIR